jgi:hypothetical protein
MASMPPPNTHRKQADALVQLVHGLPVYAEFKFGAGVGVTWAVLCFFRSSVRR